MTLGKACDHTESRRGLWDKERGWKWAGWRRVVAAGLLVPSLNGELQRPPTEPQAKGLYLPCLSVLPCYRVPCIWIPFLDPRPDGLAPVWTGKPALDSPSPHLSFLHLHCRNPGPLSSRFSLGICSASEQPPNLQC